LGRLKKFEVAGIEYYGLPGLTKECRDAVLRLLQFGDCIATARILSSAHEHALLLTRDVGDLIAIKSGFRSGYIGEGSRGLSYVLMLLEAHGADIEEYQVTPELIERLDYSALAKSDIDTVDAARPVRPSRWHEYIFEDNWDPINDGTLWREFPPVMPFAIIETRLIDLALSFWEHPDVCLIKAYRRLEDVVRERTSLNEHGVKLFSQAFVGPTSKLSWKDIDAGEQTGRGTLFTAAFMAYRNRRAHRELRDSCNGQLREFLLLNQLYVLEKESSMRTNDAMS
jgi:hypothetical protein